MKQVNLTIPIPNWLYDTAVFAVLLYRRLRYGYPFRKIPLTKGKFTIVDPEDYHHLIRYKWHATQGRSTFYAQRKIFDYKIGRQITIKMHRQLIHVPTPLVLDHINRNGLDNRKANLRTATVSQNTINRTKSKRKTHSKYKGLTWHKQKSQWFARITVNRRVIPIGYFDNETDAAHAYDTAAKKYHGQFAVLNFE